MAVEDIQMACTGVTGIRSMDFRDGMSQGPALAEIVATAHSLEIGDTVSVALGYASGSTTLITDGIVRKIITRVPDYNYAITVQDKLSRAIDYFMASDDPNDPYTASNIKAEDLVVDLLGLAGITGVSADSTIFTYGTQNPVKINLVSVWQMVQTICQITGYDCYCDGSGVVHFANRPAYITGSDTVSAYDFTTGSSGQILAVEYDRSAEQLRNRVVVYGGVGNVIKATASAVSPYLPAGFYKTMVVAHPLIDNQTAATNTASANLTLYNRLTETISLDAKGVSSIRARAIVTVTEAFTGMTSASKWLVFGSQHMISEVGYVSKYTLVR